MINGGSANFVAFDGKTFFATDHESGASGVQSNDIAPAAVDPNNPTVPEIKTAIRQAIEQMMNFKSDSGASARIGPTGLTMIVPPSMFFNSLEAINATVINNTSNVLSGAAKVIQLPDIVASNVWYLLKTDTKLRPFIFQEREPLEFSAIAEGSELEFKSGIHLYGTRWRFALSYGRWELGIRSTFA